MRRKPWYFCVLFWFIFGKDYKVVPVLNFSILKNINTARLEVADKGSPTSKGIASLFFYLASKGYLKITDNGRWALTIKKLKPYDGKSQIEKDFLDAIFPNGITEISKIELMSDQTFRKKCAKIYKKLEKTKWLWFEKNAASFGKMAVLSIFNLGLFGLFLYVLGDYSCNFYAYYVSMFFVFGVVLLVDKVRKWSIYKIVDAVIALFFICLSIYLMYFSVPNFDKNFPLILFLFVCCVISAICFVNMSKRSKKGSLVLSHILGLKNYFETVEKRKLKSDIEQNPSYFSEILCFCYVFGFFDNFMDCFENRNNKYKPEWYEGDFNKNNIGNFINDISQYIQVKKR